jgi:hypothetical protein
MMTDPKKPRKPRKSSDPIQIADLELNKETVTDLTEGEAERVKGGLRMPATGPTEVDETCNNCTDYHCGARR